MVQVGCVRMRVTVRAVLIEMRVGFAGRIARLMHMLMMSIMHMRMRVCHWLVDVLVIMTFRQMQPDANRHEHSRREELDSDRLRKHDNRDGRPKEWRGRKIGARSRRTQAPQCDNEKCQA